MHCVAPARQGGGLCPRSTDQPNINNHPVRLLGLPWAYLAGDVSWGVRNMAALRRLLAAVLIGGIFLCAGSEFGRADQKHEPTLPKVRAWMSDWQGGYAGALFSVKSFEASSLDAPPSIRMRNGKGRLAGIVAGYNFGYHAWIYGMEADVGYGQIRATKSGNHIKADLMGTLRARFGRTLEHSLLYATAGASFTGINQRSTLMVNGNTSTHLGLTVGGGIEHALARAITARLEYLYGHTLENKGLGIEHLHMVRAGIVFHLPK